MKKTGRKKRKNGYLQENGWYTVIVKIVARLQTYTWQVLELVVFRQYSSCDSSLLQNVGSTIRHSMGQNVWDFTSQKLYMYGNAKANLVLMYMWIYILFPLSWIFVGRHIICIISFGHNWLFGDISEKYC